MKSPVYDVLVLNASPCICLAKAGLLHIPERLAERVLIPHVVAAEVLAGEAEDVAKRAIERQFGERVSPRMLAQQVLVWVLGAGESAVLSVCLENPRWTAVLDDALARRCARALAVPHAGTLGLIVHAKRNGIIRSATQAINEAMAAGLYVDERIAAEARRLAGEE